MPNHFETNSVSFDALLEEEATQTPPTDTSAAEAEIPGSNPLNQPDNDPKEPETELQDKNESSDEDFLTTFLSEYGLKNGKVTYENEDGSTEEVNFNDLNTEEKLNILKELTTPNLTKDEIGVINYLRANNNATLQDVIEYYSNKAVEDYIKENGPVEKQYSIDEYSDEELYITDLKSKFEDMTDDEIKADLEIAKENEDLFKKKVDIIRKQYKAQEEEKIQESIREQEAQLNAFRDSLQSQLKDFNEVSMDYKDSKSDTLQIEDSEKEEIYKYILNQDENGATQFFKDLNDPQRLVELAWFALYGKEAISDISNYWKSQLKNTRKPEQKSTTIIVPQDKKNQRDNFTSHRNSVETDYGENLL